MVFHNGSLAIKVYSGVLSIKIIVSTRFSKIWSCHFSRVLCRSGCYNMLFWLVWFLQPVSTSGGFESRFFLLRSWICLRWYLMSIAGGNLASKPLALNCNGMPLPEVGIYGTDTNYEPLGSRGRFSKTPLTKVIAYLPVRDCFSLL